ncbi:cell wall surface anchor protein [Enterococcus faecium]|nr:cell wall surface anchor protein [Enterococcus faecium]
MNPTEPVEPITPTKTTEPTNPAEPTEPAKLVEPVNPSETPVNTDTGQVIVGVEESNPIIQLPDGTTKKVEAKEIGADVQKDGTVTVKGSDGKMKVLPKTGETTNIALSVLGSLMVLGSGIIFKKRI